MRFIVVTIVTALAVLIYLAATDQLETFTDRLWGDPQELNLELRDLHPEMDRQQFLQGLDPDRFFCTDDTREAGTDIGERACFTSLARVDGLKSQYLGLFFDDDQGLAAVNLVLERSEHEANMDRLIELFGERSHRVEHETTWLAWEREHGIFLTQEEAPEETEASLLWFREPGLMERLLKEP